MKNIYSIEIQYVNEIHKEFWFSLDKHLPVAEFNKKIRDKQGYVLYVNDKPVGILRYNLFWDNTPFCNLIYISGSHQRKGYGKTLMKFWENEMRSLGFDLLLVSTQTDECSQHFYRSIGYQDCGELNVPNQAKEIFLSKKIVL